MVLLAGSAGPVLIMLLLLRLLYHFRERSCGHIVCDITHGGRELDRGVEDQTSVILHHQIKIWLLRYITRYCRGHDRWLLRISLSEKLKISCLGLLRRLELKQLCELIICLSLLLIGNIVSSCELLWLLTSLVGRVPVEHDLVQVGLLILLMLNLPFLNGVHRSLDSCEI